MLLGGNRVGIPATRGRESAQACASSSDDIARHGVFRMLGRENQDFDKYSGLATEGKWYSTGNRSVNSWQGMKPVLPQSPGYIPFLAVMIILNRFL